MRFLIRDGSIALGLGRTPLVGRSLWGPSLQQECRRAVGRSRGCLCPPPSGRSLWRVSWAPRATAQGTGPALCTAGAEPILTTAPCPGGWRGHGGGG